MNQRTYIYFTITILLLTLSCGFFESEDPTPEIKINEVPTLTPTPAGVPAELQQLPAGLTISSGLEKLSSYSITFNHTRSQGDIEIFYQKDESAAAEQLQVTSNGIAIDNINDGDTATVSIVDDRVYVQYGETTGWISVSVAESSMIIFPDSSLIDNLVGPLPQSNEPNPQLEKINGSTTYRYEFTNHAVGNVATRGTIWLDPTGSYVIKYIATSMDGATPFEVNYDLSTINEALGITLTEEAQNATSLDSGSSSSSTPENTPTPTPVPLPTMPPPDGIPLLEDAEISNTTENSVTYSTQADMIRTVDYYNTTLTNAGWVVDTETLESDSDNFKVNFTKGASIMQLNVETQANGQLQIRAVLEE